MPKIKYEEIKQAVETLGLIGLENRTEIKKKYLILSKKFHPDTPEGSTEKFQELNKAYKIITSYIDGFQFRFTKEECIDQYPYSINESYDWAYKTV